MVLRKEITKEIKDLLKKNPHGLSITEIVGLIDVNRNTAGRYLENLLISGQVEMRRFGMAKIYMPSQRVPLSAVLSMSSELVVQLDHSLRVIFTNEPFLSLIETEEKAILGKNIEYTPISMVFEDAFAGFIERIKGGIEGKEWSGEIVLDTKNIILFCRIAPTVFEDGRRGVSVILEDITEQRRADVALRESEDRYRTLVEISPDAVFLHREGTIIYANPAAIRLLGGSYAGEIIGKEILDFVSPEFHDTIRTNIQKDLRGEVSPRTELQMVCLDGTSIIVEGQGTATIIDGIPTVQVAIRDITEQKLAEDALRKSENLYRTLAETSADLIFVIGRDDQVEFVNSYASAMVNKTVDQIIGSPRSSLFPPEVDRNQKKALETVFETGISVRTEGAITLDGQIRWFDHYLTPLKDADNRVRSVLGVSRDITERKRAEEQLYESKQLYQRLLEQTFDAIAIHKDKKIAYLNERAMKILGAASAEDLIGRSIFDFIHPDSLRDLEDRLRKLSSDHGDPAPVMAEKFFRVDGSIVTVEVMAIPFDDNGIPAIRVAFREIAPPNSAEAFQK